MSNLALGIATGVAVSNSSSSSNTKAVCEMVIDRFDSNHATVEQMKKYADCVGVVYPTEVETAAMKFFVASLFVFVIGGIIYNKIREGEWSDTIMGAIEGLGIWLVLLVVCGGIGFLIYG